MIFNAAILKNGPWSGVEWAVWQRAVELAGGKSTDEFIFLVADGVPLPSPLPGGRIVRLPRSVGTRLGRIFYELFRMPRLVRHLLSPLRDVCGGEEGGDAAFFAPAYVAPPRLPCPFTLCLYDLHVYTHPQFCTWQNRLHYRWRMPGSIRRASTIEVPSEHVRDVLLSRFPEAAGKTVVRHLSLRERYKRPVTEAEKAAVRGKYALPPRYILFVGASSPRKNLPAALAAWRAIRADGEDIGFVIVGKSPVRDMARDGEDGALVAPGHVTDEDMPALYAGAAVLLYPSFDEGYGLPIAEARACGCPVVTSSPTAREIAPDAFSCGTDEASVTAALRAALRTSGILASPRR